MRYAMEPTGPICTALTIACLLMVVLGSFPTITSPATVAPGMDNGTEPMRAGVMSTEYPFDDFTHLWVRRDGSNPSPTVGMEFFGTNWVGVSPFEVDTAYSPASLNDSSLFPPDSKIIVHIYKPLNKERTFRNITDAAKNNSRIVGILWDDYPVGRESPSNWSTYYRWVHREDANLSQGPLKMWLVVYVTNYWRNEPYTWASIDPYYDAVQFWYYPISTGVEGSTVAGFEAAAKEFRSIIANESKRMVIGIYLHYYEFLGGNYPVQISVDLLKASARLISGGYMSGMSVLENRWIWENPETAYLVRNFIQNEMKGGYATLWIWDSNAVTTSRQGVPSLPAISEIREDWAGNRTFISHHHQNVTVIGFQGQAATVQNRRTGEFLEARRSGADWYFYASPNEEYRIFDMPLEEIVYSSNVTFPGPTSFDSKLVTVHGKLHFNSTLWINNSIIQFVDDMRSIEIGAVPHIGLVAGGSPWTCLFAENSTIRSLNPLCAASFDTTPGAASGSRVLSIRNCTFSSIAGTVQWCGSTYLYDNLFFNQVPDGSTRTSYLKQYAPGFTWNFEAKRNRVWNYYQTNAIGMLIMAGGLNYTGTYRLEGNEFWGGFTGVHTVGDASLNTSLSYAGLGNIHSFANLLQVDYTDISGETFGADKLYWHFAEFSLRTDVPISGTLTDANGRVIGDLTSSQGYVNSSVCIRHGDASGYVTRYPFPWTLNITSALPAGRYYALTDDSVFSANRTAWEYPIYRELNGTSFKIWEEEFGSLHLREMELSLWTGITNYVSPESTLTWDDSIHCGKKYNWTTPTLARVSAVVDRGILSVWDLTRDSTPMVAARWKATSSISDSAVTFSVSDLEVDGTYDIYVDSVLHLPFQRASDGMLQFDANVAWGVHEFALLNSTIVDSDAPVTQYSVSGTGGLDGWYISPTTVTLSAVDDLSGVSSTMYRLDSGTWTQYGGGFGFEAEGIHWLEFYSTDYSGNHEAVREAPICIDLSLPEVHATLLGTQGYNGWHIGDNVRVQLMAIDEVSGVSSVWYGLDSGELLPYANEITIQSVGVTLVEYYVVDVAGHVGENHLLVLKFDPGLPVLSASLENNTRLTRHEVRIILQSSDEISGVNRTEYSLDGQGFSPCADGYLYLQGLSDGKHHLILRSTDNAGNIATLSLSFSVSTSVLSPWGPVGPWLDIAVIAGALLALLFGIPLLKRRMIGKAR